MSSFIISIMGKISNSQLEEIRDFYYKNKLNMREIAEKLDVSIDAVVYFMRRHNLKRRSFFEINKLRFDRKKPSFKVRSISSIYEKNLKLIGAVLYWCEGYKSEKSTFVDFANSDPEMILVFLNFLRKVYNINEKKLRILLYCYSDQDINNLIKFWSNLTKIPANQFTKPYIRRDFKNTSRKMEYGLIHVRYIDKKLLLAIKDLINYNKKKFAQVVP